MVIYLYMPELSARKKIQHTGMSVKDWGKWRINKVCPVYDRKKCEDMSHRLDEIDRKYRLLWEIGIDTGLRISDLVKLRANIKPHGQLVINEQKTRKIRTITLTEPVAALVASYIALRRPRRGEYLIYGRNPRRPLSRSQAYRVLSAAAIECGIDGKIGAHSMRYTYAVRLYKSTGDIFAVQKALNHKYVTTTIGYLTGDLNSINFLQKLT